MITLNKKPGERYLELGGGSNPVLVPTCRGGQDVCCDVRSCVDAQGRSTVDFVANFNKPLPIQDQEFHGVFCKYALEHVSYLEIPGFLREVYRVVKPGGKVVFVVPNTEAQLKWIQANPNGWDGKDLFNSASEKLFGTLDYPENSHKAYLSPDIVMKLFHDAGFGTVKTTPFGTRDTDMVIEAVKGSAPNGIVMSDIPGVVRKGEVVAIDTRKAAIQRMIDDVQPTPRPAEEVFEGVEAMPTPPSVVVPVTIQKEYEPAKFFDKNYFRNPHLAGALPNFGYFDGAWNDLIAKSILYRRPKSVLELGCGRAFVGKRLEDTGVLYVGIDVSKHCYMTRAADKVVLHNIASAPWSGDIWGCPTPPGWDLSLSINVLEHIPENLLSNVLQEIKRTCSRHLHVVDSSESPNPHDPTKVIHKPLSWWRNLFSNHGLQDYEILARKDLEQGELPEEFYSGDGKVKLNLGSHMVMSHHGWENVDAADLTGYAQHYRYKFKHHDLRNGLPYNTGSVSLIHISHALEHFTSKEALTLLKECRRVLTQDGAIRVVVPDVSLLMKHYQDPSWVSPEGCTLDDFAHINDDVENAATPMEKYWVLAQSGHQNGYDETSLAQMFKQAGFHPLQAGFRKAGCKEDEQINRETNSSFPCLSLALAGVPVVG